MLGRSKPFSKSPILFLSKHCCTLSNTSLHTLSFYHEARTAGSIFWLDTGSQNGKFSSTCQFSTTRVFTLTAVFVSTLFSSPLLSYRRTDINLVTAGCVGFAATDTELRVVDPEANPEMGERKALPDGMVGVVLGRGPQIMRGYYKNPEATAKAIDKWGWFDTGDLGKINPVTGDLILTGRAKDTIVLSNGENIEPQPLEGEQMPCRYFILPSFSAPTELLLSLQLLAH